jgi:hypothetical protein
MIYRPYCAGSPPTFGMSMSTIYAAEFPFIGCSLLFATTPTANVGHLL